MSVAFRPTTFKVPPQPPSEIISIKKFRGINQNATPTQIHDSESPDMLNRVLDIKEATDTRFGYSRIFTTSLGAGQINGLFQFKKQDGTKLFLIHWGTGLYTQTGSAQPVLISSLLANAKSKYFTFANYCYIFDGTNFLRTDGVTTVDVSTVAYVPRLTLGRAPTGGGATDENVNLIGAGFYDSFTSPGAVTTYQLSFGSLDATAVTATVNGASQVEGTGFTVNRTTGLVTFAAAPPVGTANNVQIFAFKTFSGFANYIKNCTGFEIYGGTNDTRVFAFGNPAFPNTLRRCDLNKPTYWPNLAFNLIGSDAGIIKGMKKQYSSAIIVKEPTPNDTTAWKMNYSIDINGVVTFPTVPLNSRFACVAADTFHLIENNPLFLSPNGSVRVEGTNVSDQRDIVRISDDINRSLLGEANLQNAIAVDYDKKYIIGINNKCYVMDYRITYPDDGYKSPWLIWDNIPASCFLEIDSYLYFGSNVTGLVYRFNKATDSVPIYSDDGVAINDYWQSKIYSFNDDEHLKTVIKTFFSLKPASSTSADLYYRTDKTLSDLVGTSSGLVTTRRMDLFNFQTINFANFTFLLSAMPQEVASKVKAKKIDYFQMVLQNPRNNESMGILSIAFKVQTNREFK